MELIAFTPSMLLAILPEIGLIVLGALVLVLDLVWRGSCPAQPGLGHRRRPAGDRQFWQ